MRRLTYHELCGLIDSLEWGDPRMEKLQHELAVRQAARPRRPHYADLMR